MLKLILLRHGKAANPIDSQNDFERPLNRKGVVQINQIGHLLANKEQGPTQIISSSAKRTNETTEIVNHYLKISNLISDQDLYLAEESFILSYIRDKANAPCILYVGHNFGISNLASTLAGNSISMSTGMMVTLSFNVDEWKDVVLGSGKLDFAYAPDIYLP